ncbi:DUF1810 domain-containing protein [Kineococcus sp. SYSU DK004]|uniref:DUF1810 domain-containing protein n=1 Tax=Kineococcus sp. SYSU DK004 TaxID=3383125 RepID=UPI003D7DEC5D
MEDPYDLQRFVDAQDAGGHEAAVAELRAGRKRSHWMWFVFPQVTGLGRSATAVEFSIADLDEARAYLAHPVLGPRLRECARLAASAATDDPEALLGPTDALKLRSSMTLFAAADPDEPVFAEVLERFYGGLRDPLTQRALADRA